MFASGILYQLYSDGTYGDAFNVNRNGNQSYFKNITDTGFTIDFSLHGESQTINSAICYYIT